MVQELIVALIIEYRMEKEYVNEQCKCHIRVHILFMYMVQELRIVFVRLQYGGGGRGQHCKRLSQAKLSFIIKFFLSFLSSSVSFWGTSPSPPPLRSPSSSMKVDSLSYKYRECPAPPKKKIYYFREHVNKLKIKGRGVTFKTIKVFFSK